jgi:hypothetical protein
MVFKTEWHGKVIFLSLCNLHYPSLTKNLSLLGDDEYFLCLLCDLRVALFTLWCLCESALLVGLVNLLQLFAVFFFFLQVF